MQRLTSQMLVLMLMAIVAAPLAAQQQNKKKKQPTLAERTLKRFAKAELTEEQTLAVLGADQELNLFIDDEWESPPIGETAALMTMNAGLVIKSWDLSRR